MSGDGDVVKAVVDASGVGEVVDRRIEDNPVKAAANPELEDAAELLPPLLRGEVGTRLRVTPDAPVAVAGGDRPNPPVDETVLSGGVCWLRLWW